MTRPVAAVSISVCALLLAAPAAAADAVKSPTFAKDVAPIFQAKCEAAIAPIDGADVAGHLSGSAPLGQVDQGACHRAADAAVAHRQERRHPGVQERSLAERSGNRHHRALGRRRRADGRPQRDAAPVEWPDASAWNLAELFGGRPTHREAPSFTMPAQAQDVWEKPHADGRDGAAVGARHRDPARHGERSPDRPSLGRAPDQDDPSDECRFSEQRR